VELPSYDTDQLLQTAARALSEGRQDEARDCLQQILKVDAGHFDALHVLGVLAFQDGNYDEADDLIRKAIAVNSGFSEAHYNLGNVLRRKGRMQEAAASYHAALELNPALDPAWFNLGLTEMELGNPARASEAFHRAAESDPNDPDYAFSLGNALWEQGDLAGARRQFEQTVKANAQHAHAWNNLGILLREAGELDYAFEAYSRALKTDPNFADAQFNLGNLYEELGDLDNALASYQKAVYINPAFAKAFNNLGNIYYSLKRFDEARDAYDKALILDPASESARHMIHALEGTTTDTAPPEYVKRLFDKAAPEFEERLVQSLRYQSPKELRAMLDRIVPAETTFTNAVDLGCGTGLSAEAFRSRTQRIVGVDLSEKMVRRAEQKSIYDALFAEDLTGFLSRSTERYDLFLATDVLVYIGNLRPLFEAVRQRAAQSAWFLFSVERVDEGEFILRRTGRYAHSRDYIETLSQEYGFHCEAIEETVVRTENDQPIPGYNVILKLKEST